MRAEVLPGLRVEPGGGRDPGIRLVVSEPATFRPATSLVALLATLQQMHGADAVWGAPGTRERFFDKLLGTPAVRRRLQAGDGWRDIVRDWPAARRSFERARRAALLYA
jgi:uncharacterized protein YbbC (DUF1343 family)